MMQSPSDGGLREDNTMNRRLLLVGSAVGLFATVAIGPMPAAATPCTALKMLDPQDMTITIMSADDNTTGSFTVPNTNPQITLTGLPPFCRVTATRWQS
jgi:feruloyl esterase